MHLTVTPNQKPDIAEIFAGHVVAKVSVITEKHAPGWTDVKKSTAELGAVEVDITNRYADTSKIISALREAGYQVLES